MKKEKRNRPIVGFSMGARTKEELDRYSKMTQIPRSRLVEQALRIAYGIGGKRDD